MYRLFLIDYFDFTMYTHCHFFNLDTFYVQRSEPGVERSINAIYYYYIILYIHVEYVFGMPMIICDVSFG